MKRYSIMARECGQDKVVELCQCDSNPDQIVQGVRDKRIKIDRRGHKVFIDKYEHVYFVDHEQAESA